MPPLTLAPLVHFAGIALGLLLAALLWGGGRGNRAANRWLAGYVAALVAGLPADAAPRGSRGSMWSRCLPGSMHWPSSPSGSWRYSPGAARSRCRLPSPASRSPRSWPLQDQPACPHIQSYARRHPEKVAGLLLVDSTHWDPLGRRR